jgi:pimeloyl-ACP methyl ester carboxylesterase
VCLPGGGMSRRYYDLELPTYSMARHLVAAGFAVIMVDPPGVGESDRPDDGYTLTPAVVADTIASAVDTVVARFGNDAVKIGVGHSAGGLLTVVQQARHRTYDALALLGFAGRGLVDVLTPDELAYAGDQAGLEGAVAQLVKARFGDPLPQGSTASSPFLVWGDPPRDAIEAIDKSSAAMLALVGLTSMVPGSIAAELAAIDVPAFIGVGDHDITGPAHAIPADLPNSTDVTLYVLPDAGHNHHVAATREQLWDRLAAWAATISAGRGAS